MLSKLPFDRSIFDAALRGEPGLLRDLLAADEAARPALKKYATNSKESQLFHRDLASAFAKLTIVGAAVTGAKVLRQ
jgi:hypothetical protein